MPHSIFLWHENFATRSDEYRQAAKDIILSCLEDWENLDGDITVIITDDVHKSEDDEVMVREGKVLDEWQGEVGVPPLQEPEEERRHRLLLEGQERNALRRASVQAGPVTPPGVLEARRVRESILLAGTGGLPRNHTYPDLEN
ncbi:unnamed protein product [Sympodiomycopsis kandeliae]